MSTRLVMGVDIGGTSIKAALLDSSGTILSKREEPTPVSLGEDGVIARVGEIAVRLLETNRLDTHHLAGIGVGVPGAVNVQAGVVYHAVNLGWKETPLREKLEAYLGIPVLVDNDANIAALGEMWKGAGQGTTDLIAITLGTGVGGGVIVNGQIIHGVNGASGEIGHMTMVPNGGPPCNCGKTGCLESYASATAIIRAGTKRAQSGESALLSRLLAANGSLEAKDIFAAAQAGDEAALAIVDEAAFYLGLALSHLANVLNPGKIVIGGGVAAAGEFLFSRVRTSFTRFVAFPVAAASCEILPATLGNDAGVIGAGWLVRARL